MPRLEWEKQTEHQANVTPNSSATASSKSDVDNLHLFQVMLTINEQGLDMCRNACIHYLFYVLFNDLIYPH